jgi:hypothetical protein
MVVIDYGCALGTTASKAMDTLGYACSAAGGGQLMDEAKLGALFSVSNHHTAHCGEPPVVNGDDPGVYHGYFENCHGEQFVFVCHRNTAEGTLWAGDAGWQQPHAVVEGKVDLILSPEEELWLQACWQAATVSSERVTKMDSL